MLGMSNRAVNENAFGHTSLRGSVRDDTSVPKRHEAARHAARESRVAQRDDHRITGLAALGDPWLDASRLGVAEVDEVDHRLVRRVRLVERRFVVVQARALERGRTSAVAEPLYDSGVRREQSRRAQEKRRLACPARTDDRDGLARGDREVDLGDRLRTRQTRSASGDEALCEARDIENVPHADR